MEFDCIYLPDSRRYLLKLPTEQHALQCFLLDEFDRYASAYQPLRDALAAIVGYQEYGWQGREYSLRVERGEVLVWHHSLTPVMDGMATSTPDEHAEWMDADDLQLDHTNLQSECGVEDLLHLLDAWMAFLPAAPRQRV